ncbi:hypothetical protein [Vibrio owensii]|uniref:Uncharacterized protein n=1 Tax=Vibrio owensii CAIM 1854 = LMG 25443 TaxID=1229493 RepID=A0A0C1WAI5_9VIBR|nr:hypothetical protein [Vibrio owensii]KIF53322.1 hypothetical protein H735_10385 [Vibrio owensii CAIM 1854 = LMG 25443]
MSGIKCSECGWVSKSRNDLDAGVEFSNHIAKFHTTGKPDPKIMAIPSGDITISESIRNGEPTYGIYVNSSYIGAAGHIYFKEDKKLHRRAKLVNEEDKDEVFALAVDIAKYLKVSVHHTKFAYPYPRYVALVYLHEPIGKK